jgi:hypothetical protein
MNRRSVAYTAIVVIVVACLIGVSILAVAAGGSAFAYQLNGTKVSQHDFDQQLDDIADNQNTKTASHSEGSVDSAVTAQLMTLNIARDLLRDAADRRGVEVSDADRAKAKQAVGTQLDKYPASYRNLILDLRSYGYALGLTSDNQLNSYLAKQLAKANVRVNPRYGFWNPKYGVCPPTGCASLQSGAGGSSSGG